MAKKRKKKMAKHPVQASRFSYLSEHAILRLRQRTQLQPNEMNHLLDNHGYFRLGSHAGFHREHLLFYSPKDDTCFVAIQDHRMGKVVTILPTNYHKNLAWTVTENDCEQAKLQYEIYYQQYLVEKPPEIAHPPVTPKPPPKVQKSADIVLTYRLHHHQDDQARLEFLGKEGKRKKAKFILTVTYIGMDLKIKRKTLFNVKAEKYEHNTALLWQDSAILTKIDDTIAKKNLHANAIFLLEVLNRDKNLIDYLTFREHYEAVIFVQGYLVKRQAMYDLLRTLDFNQQQLIFLPKWQHYPRLTFNNQKLTHNKKSPRKKQLAKVIFMLILLTLIYQVFKQKIKGWFRKIHF